MSIQNWFIAVALLLIIAPLGAASAQGAEQDQDASGRLVGQGYVHFLLGHRGPTNRSLELDVPQASSEFNDEVVATAVHVRPREFNQRNTRPLGLVPRVFKQLTDE